MRVYRDLIEVITEGPRPRLVRWRRRSYRVLEVLDFWVSQGTWWTREERRLYMRIATDDGVMEIYRTGEEWWLSRLFD